MIKNIITFIPLMNVIIRLISIILNVSGKIFRVSRDVICKSQLFNGMLTDCVVDSEIMIDRSAKLFEHVYAYLLDDRYPYPQKYYAELDYYLVPYDIELLYYPNKTQMQELEKKIEKMEKVLDVAFDKICELDFNGARLCQYFGCRSRCESRKGTCYSHANLCCHHIRKDGSSPENCQNKVHGCRTYCDDHVSDYLL